MQTYKRLPVSFTQGNGCWLQDSNGKQYLDGLCGISVTNLGHHHSAVTATIQAQSQKLLHTSNLYHIEAQEQLAEQLCQAGNMQRVFFGNSGAEANEAAIKLARLHAHNHGNHQPLIITFGGSFHGRTLGTIAATGNDAIKAGFEPQLEGFMHLPFNDIDAATQAFAQHSNIAAVLIEPVQGEGGINIAEPAYLLALQNLCQQHNALFMLDEIQTGNGRCGRYFAYQLFDHSEFALKPDVITTAKALGNGIPIGACLACGDAATTMAPGKHGSTFGGNPFASAVASTVVKTIIEEKFDQRAAQLGQQFLKGFQSRLQGNAIVSDIRSCGLMIGIELSHACGELMLQGLQQGIIINVTAGNVVRLLPPLVMSNDEANTLLDKVTDLIEQFAQTTVA